MARHLYLLSRHAITFYLGTYSFCPDTPYLFAVAPILFVQTRYTCPGTLHPFSTSRYIFLCMHDILFCPGSLHLLEKTRCHFSSTASDRTLKSQKLQTLSTASYTPPPFFFNQGPLYIFLCTSTLDTFLSRNYTALAQAHFKRRLPRHYTVCVQAPLNGRLYYK